MEAEQTMINALELSKELSEEQRLIFFQIMAGVSIAYIRGSQGNMVTRGFLSAAMKDNIIMTIDDIKNTIEVKPCAENNRCIAYNRTGIKVCKPCKSSRR
jgi:hypothetical protein